jgi:hypothetical protein
VTSEDEVMRLLRRADPERGRAEVPSVDGSEYLAALRARSSDVDYMVPEPTLAEPPTNGHRWLLAAAATVAVIAGGLVLAARDDDETGVGSNPPPVTEGAVEEGPVTTPPAPPAGEVAASEDAAARVGFIGLPPEGATPSTPQGGEVVVSIRACHTPTGELSGSATLFPPLGELTVLADGRLIWLKYQDLPEGANSLSTGLLQQHLTPEGVELMRSAANAALNSGEPQHCGTEGYHDVYQVYAGAWPDSQNLRDDDEHLARVIDPWSWLPATAWEDPEIRAYVPSTYLVTIYASDDVPRDELTAQLPAAAADLAPANDFLQQVSPYAPLTTEEARAFAAALEDAGFERDGRLNAYELDYQLEYHNESRDTVHVVFRVHDLEAMLYPAALQGT